MPDPHTADDEGSFDGRRNRWPLVLGVTVLATAAIVVAAGLRGRDESAAQTADAEPPLAISTGTPVPAPTTEPLPSASAGAKPHSGQSVGTPRDGSLRDGTRLPPGEGYVLRHPDRVYGTNGTVQHLQAVLERVLARYPHAHDLAVGDLSRQGGGPLLGHTSHQSGRDVDIGFFYKKRPRGHPAFVAASRSNLDLAATWGLLEALAETSEAPQGVAWMLLDYRVQKLLHAYARGHGVPDETLAKILQYPRGRTAEAGLVRHFPGHDDHVHVRFRCASQEPDCRTGIGPWKRLRVGFPQDDADVARTEQLRPDARLAQAPAER